MEKFRHGRVIFAGDSAHQVSPFGARGANSGLQDVDNLGWKLAAVIKGQAQDALLDTYDIERIHGADENILNSSRSTDFITPKSDTSRIFRDAVLDLSEKYAFARPLVNSGRLSMPCSYDGMPLNGVDAVPDAPARSRPGMPCPDAPYQGEYLLSHLGGTFTLLALNTKCPEDIKIDGFTISTIGACTKEAAHHALAERYLGDAQQAVYLIRPDQHVVARWPEYDETAVKDAIKTALGENL